MTPHISANTKRLTGVKEMDKEVIAALRRIATIAHYYRDAKLHSDEVYQAFDGIMGEAYEAIETLTAVKEQDQ
jgi:hypothetical protein